MDARGKIGHEECVSRPGACLIIPHPVRQERQVELLWASGTKIVSFAPIVAKRTPYRARKIDITWQVEPNDGLRSGQSQIKMGTIVAVHHPRVASRRFRYPLTKLSN